MKICFLVQMIFRDIVAIRKKTVGSLLIASSNKIKIVNMINGLHSTKNVFFRNNQRSIQQIVMTPVKITKKLVMHGIVL